MKVQDFEKAIEGLGCQVVLDEVKILHGHVRQCYGHQGQTLVMWDDLGHGFSYSFDKELSEEDFGMMQEFKEEINYERDNVYDLKLFE